MTLCIIAIAVTSFSMLISLFLSFTPLKLRACYEEYDGIELLERRVPVGSKEIGGRVQHRIDEVHHGQKFPQKTQAKHVNILFVPTHAVLRNSTKDIRIDDVGYAAELGAHV
jgi:hypothetical protein